MPKKWLQVINEAVKKIEENEIELGIKVLQKVQEHGKQLPEVMLYLADVWYQLGHLEEATSLLKETVALHPAMNKTLLTEFHLLLAEIALDEGEFERAQELLYELKESGFDGVQLYLLLADLYAAQELEEVAVKYLEKAKELDPDNVEIASALGEMYIQLGQFDNAQVMLDQIEMPSAASLLFHGRTLAQGGDFEQAYAAFAQALELERTAEGLYGAGLMAFHLGQLEAARGLIEELLVIDEEYVAAFPLLSDIYLSLGKTDMAIDKLIRYVDLSGFDLEHIQRLIALLLQSGRYDEAKQYQKMFESWNEAETGLEQE